MVTGKRLASRLDEQPTIVINGDKALTTATNVTLLGLEIDSRLSFNNHVDKICKKLSQRIRVYLPLNQRKQFYNAVIRPVINYVSVIWTACDKECLSRVLKLQKRAARVILF